MPEHAQIIAGNSFQSAIHEKTPTGKVVGLVFNGRHAPLVQVNAIEKRGESGVRLKKVQP